MTDLSRILAMDDIEFERWTKDERDKQQQELANLTNVFETMPLEPASFKEMFQNIQQQRFVPTTTRLFMTEDEIRAIRKLHKRGEFTL